MLKLLILIVSTSLLFSCTKEKQEFNIQVPVEMEYSWDVVEQDNVNHYIVQVSNDGKIWTDVAVMLAETAGMEHEYIVKVDVSRYYNKDTRFYQRVISNDNDGKFQISKITSIFFE